MLRREERKRSPERQAEDVLTGLVKHSKAIIF